jgi:hypothetical protein
MLKIRSEQMKVFEQASSRSFEDLMVQHIKEFAPKHVEAIGDQVVHQIVVSGIERAREYGFTTRGPVRFYIELMFMLGSDFDTDLQLPWAAETLKKSDQTPQHIKADELYDKAMDYVDKVIGSNYEFEIEALRRGLQIRLEDVPVSSRSSFRDEALTHLRRLYPQKCEYMGETRLRLLIQRGLELAQRKKISNDKMAAIFIGLMFTFGHGCFTDPQFPWIASTLNDDQEKQVVRLYARLMNYLNFGLKNLENM